MGVRHGLQTTAHLCKRMESKSLNLMLIREQGNTVRILASVHIVLPVQAKTPCNTAQEHINASRPKMTGNRGGQKRKPGAKSQKHGGQAKRRRQRQEHVQDANEPDDAANHVDMAEQMADEHHDPDAEDGIVNGDAQDGEDSEYTDSSEGQPSLCFGF